MGRVAAISIALALLGVVAGCGDESGVTEGATVAVYADAGLCAAAEQTLAAAGRKAGDVRVDLRCLPPVRRDGRLDLARVGANARRATQDSTAVAYLLAPGRAVAFATPILDAAGIGWTVTSSGAAAATRLLDLIAVADTADLRASLRDSLSG